MAYLANTTKSSQDKKKNNHTHIAYVSDKIENIDENGNGVIGYTSTENGHFHEIMYISPKPPQIDQATGQMIQEATPEKYVIMPTQDGHMHEIGELLSIDDDNLEKKTNKDEQKKRLEELHSAMRRKKQRVEIPLINDALLGHGTFVRNYEKTY